MNYQIGWLVRRAFYLKVHEPKMKQAPAETAQSATLLITKVL